LGAATRIDGHTHAHLRAHLRPRPRAAGNEDQLLSWSNKDWGEPYSRRIIRSFAPATNARRIGHAASDGPRLRFQWDVSKDCMAGS
jgi:hypothetical protein